MNANLGVNLHNAFKAATATQGVDMTAVLQKFIESYVDKYESVISKTGRRV